MRATGKNKQHIVSSIYIQRCNYLSNGGKNNKNQQENAPINQIYDFFIEHSRRLAASRAGSQAASPGSSLASS